VKVFFDFSLVDSMVIGARKENLKTGYFMVWQLEKREVNLCSGLG